MDMFENTFDPLARLEALEINVTALNSDKIQLARAVNHQIELLDISNKQIKNLVEQLKIQETQIQLMFNQLNSRNLR
jgi:hypothetical protein